MKGLIIGIILMLSLGIIIFDWSNIHKRRDRIVFLALCIVTGLFAIILTLFPNMPNITQFVMRLFPKLSDYL
ncbi:hypothetical protein GCM10011391_34440 [Pullulanibacillus camelliae]|uniref:Uncharacterized protein n=1 Tax=Pullulanibacillus camelliae TaxID=1707096 RepID=A0A8J3DY33_9BACL|nr:hypothetical protein [Pullulanibacillus camelliae]GGE52695.1 hypothetical protein GCM10011391_34440 [Pullulanibacillus camelliae]